MTLKVFSIYYVADYVLHERASFLNLEASVFRYDFKFAGYLLHKTSYMCINISQGMTSANLSFQN